MNFSVNPKVALDQVLNSYEEWISLNLNDCEAPWKGTNKRNHLVSFLCPSNPDDEPYNLADMALQIYL